MALPKLSPSQPIVSNLRPSSPFLAFMEALRTAIIGADTSLQEQITRIDEQVERITRAIRANSYTTGLTLGAEADGATAKITVSSHIRRYLDGNVNVSAGEVDGLDYATEYAVYYDDEDREGGTVTYEATENGGDAVTSNANPDREFVGYVTTPATSGDPPTTGGGTLPPLYPPDGPPVSE